MTIGWLAPFYLWTKALHIIAMVAWMAGMFYLPRLYVYHCETAPGSAESERFKVMERRLLKQIINPAMIATWTFGILLVLTPGVHRLVGGLVAREARRGDADVRLARRCVALAAGFPARPQHAGRSASTASPTRSRRCCWSLIVIMVIVRPF